MTWLDKWMVAYVVVMGMIALVSHEWTVFLMSVTFYAYIMYVQKERECDKELKG